ncbi:MAG TPA: hydrogenase maturation nickel metallochaperone HypA [Candidatus Lustribacter sp.]
MHELSVALSLIEGIQESALSGGFERVLAVRVRVGALSGISPDALRFSWQLASVGTLAADSSLEIEDVPLVVFCAYCETERTPHPGTGLICPECTNVAPTIVRGRDLQLVAVEVPE